MADLPSCARCRGQYPVVKIVWCRATKLIIGGLYLCVTCHRTVHGYHCKSYKEPTCLKQDLMCSVCQSRLSRIICPLCSIKEEDQAITVTMCEECNKEQHVDHREVHLDHVLELPAR